MKKFLDLSSWRTALGNLLPSAHGHQGGSRKAIGSMLIMAFAVVGCGDDDSWSPSARSNDEPGIESSSSSSGKVTEPAEVTSSSSSVDTISSSSLQGDKNSSSSGQNEASSSSVALATPCKTETEDNCEYGTVLDDRDGQTYKTVKIGDQWWMAENLNYKTDNSFCYKDSAEYCEKYGRLYTWAAAMDSAGTWSTNGKGCGYNKTCSRTYPVRGICPEGWHLPRYGDWNTLFTAVGGSSTAGAKLKSQTGWKTYDGITNEDSFGFSALPAGYRHNDGDYYFEGLYAYFWSSTEGSSAYAYYLYLDYDNDSAYLDDNDKDDGHSVRCVKD